jgi:hypothetical protein
MTSLPSSLLAFGHWEDSVVIESGVWCAWIANSVTRNVLGFIIKGRVLSSLTFSPILPRSDQETSIYRVYMAEDSSRRRLSSSSSEISRSLSLIGPGMTIPTDNLLTTPTLSRYLSGVSDIHGVYLISF